MESGVKILTTVKRIALAIEQRNTDLRTTCPTLCSNDDERDNRLRELAASQAEVDAGIKELRELTEGRLDGYCDAEVLLLMHLFGGIWSTECSFSVNSTNVTELCGHNNMPETSKLILGIINKSSKIFRYVSISWETGRRTGYFEFHIIDQVALHRLFLSDDAAPQKE